MRTRICQKVSKGIRMKYYVTADLHGFFSVFRDALEKKGFFLDQEPHKLIILGDLFDRGNEAILLQDFILRMMEQDSIILIRGNHEDLFEEMITTDHSLSHRKHVMNGTYDTALQLTGYDPAAVECRYFDFAAEARKTPYFASILPTMLNYYETEHYIFTHGWIPCAINRDNLLLDPNWRNATEEQWRSARWINGMDAAQTCMTEKTVVCGHWHASYGHAVYEHKGSEFGPGADFSPYYAPRIIALDACTASSRKVNVIVVED